MSSEKINTGLLYKKIIGSYILQNFSDRKIKIYDEVSIGKSIIGKNRKVDLVVFSEEKNSVFLIECKYQNTQGTADEKIPYTLQDMASIPLPAVVVYTGKGFSEGILHMLQASEIAAFCLPDESLNRSKSTLELDHFLAMHFNWFDLVLDEKSLLESSQLNQYVHDHIEQWKEINKSDN
ncbi:hypothetical protein KKF34_11040 [Myxococcota bacterium]|nr:hypothetical protein [Myxococcota bacterium]MBU1379914.1 hypothetical protein [Myxococcota bacterium]MBU1497401.1 hypothetical protein [Myxococcota bacterium]